MNDYDVARMVEVMRRSGYERTDDAEQADLIIINTCSIREKAENKAVSAAGRYRPLKERRPDPLTASGAGLAQHAGEALPRRVPPPDLTFLPDHTRGPPGPPSALADAHA